MEYWNNFALECALWHRNAARNAPNRRLREKNERAERFWLGQMGS